MFGENPLMSTQVIILKQKMDGQTDVQRTDGYKDGHTDVQHETILPRHYRVAGYKKYQSNEMASCADSSRLCVLTLTCLNI